MSQYMIIDTREKPKAIEGILKHFDSVGVQYERSKLLFGDYMDYSKPNLVVDRKQNIAELAKNCTVEVKRFKEEINRAQRANSELVILVEQNRYKDRDEWVKVESISDLLRWSNPHSTIRGEQIFRVLANWCRIYPLRIEFCDKRSTGKRLLEIIYGE